MTASVVIFSVASSDYLSDLCGLVQSLKRNVTKEHLCHVTLVLTEEERTKENEYKSIIRHVNDAVLIDVEIHDFESIQAKRCYCAGLRIPLFAKLRAIHPNCLLLWLDADTIIRRKCSDFFETMLKHDVSIRAKPSDKTSLQKEKTSLANGKYWSGIIGISPTSAGNAFIQAYNMHYQNLLARNLNWFNDQKALDGAFTDVDNLSHYDIPKQYMDFHMADSSPIWVCKGTMNGGRSGSSWKREILKLSD